MTYRMKAIYRGGELVPETRCGLPENAEVDLLVQGPLSGPPVVTNPKIAAECCGRLPIR